MNIPAHLARLEEKHANLDKRIEKEQSRPSPDHSIIQSMKRQKLRLKEEIQQLNREEAPG